MTARAADVLTGLGLLALLAAVSLTAPRWARFFRQPVVAVEEPGAPDAPAAARPPEPQAEEVQRTISVKLFFESKGGPGLVMEERTVPFSADLADQVRVVVEELIRGSQTGLESTLVPETKVLDVFVAPRGVGYVDLSKHASEGQHEGSDAELLAVYSVVNSVTVNLPSIKRVQILIDGRPASTLAGHVDISRPLASDMTFLAASTLTPAEPATPSAVSPPSTTPAAASPGAAANPAQ